MAADRTPRRRLIVAAPLLVGLAACAAPPPDAGPETAAPVAAEPPQTASVAPPQAVIPPPPPQPAPAPEIDAPDPAALIGQRADELEAQLGIASLVRRDLGAEVRQYRTAECVLFLFLYPGDGAPTVSHLEVRGDLDVGDCVKSVVRAKLSLGTG